MILKALVDYYERLLKDAAVDIPAYGFQDKPIPFLIVIDQQGNFVNIRDTRTVEGKKKTARSFRLPLGEKRSFGIKPNLLWDNPQYVLGEPKAENDKERNKALESLESFTARLKNDLADLTDKGIAAILHFYENNSISQARTHPLFTELKAENSNLTFTLDNDVELIAQRPLIVERIRTLYEQETTQDGVSAISGNHDQVAKLHTAIKGVWGAQTSGANIVSFNDEAYCSYGKKQKHQGYNAPIGRHDEFAYTTALNWLLASRSQRAQLGDSSTVFWAQEVCALETDINSIFKPPKDEEAQSYDKIRNLLASVKNGIPPEEAEIPFYVLGLAPNAARISIRFWYAGNIKDIKERIAQHYHDIEIVHSPKDSEFLSLYKLLISIAFDNKIDNVPPNLSGELVRSILVGSVYPRTLFVNALIRIKAEQNITHGRAAIIKSFLVRNARINKTEHKEVGMSLDKKYDNIGYVLGRLFAVYEYIQGKKSHTLNRTIRDAYFNAAASTPQITFKRLNDLSLHHLTNLRNSGENIVWLEKMIGQIVDLIPPTGYPPMLSMEDQGRFYVGYYHQHRSLYTKKNAEKQGENNE